MTHSLRVLALLLAPVLAAGLSGAAGNARADEMPDAQRVMVHPLATLPPVDRLVLRKSERKLFLMHGEDVVRSYKVALGLNPVGQKERAGDFRTPEGQYRLIRRNHWEPGGSIMIHGLPNQLKHTPGYYDKTDWTDGCIAVSNADMVEIWLLTPDDAPIAILP